MNKTYIIAEIGCNHNGVFDNAIKMIDLAKQSGADAVKFQIFNSRDLISKIAPKANYQKKGTSDLETQLEMTKKLELSQQDYLKILDYCQKEQIDVFATPFDIGSIDFLEKVNQSIWKIPSGEINNIPYLERLIKVKKAKIFILSTGMSTLKEVKFCVDFLSQSKKKIFILHCNTEYPTPTEDINLNSIKYLEKHFPKYDIGFSDHSSNIYASIASIAIGAKIIERHVTLDKDMEGPDHKASLDFVQFEQMCKGIREVEVAMGKYGKFVTGSEKKNIFIARKSIVAKKEIKKGELFTTENITTKRPGNGISSLYWHKILGKKAEQNFKEDDLISLKKIKWEEQKWKK